MIRARTSKQMAVGNRITGAIAFALLVLYAAGLRAETTTNAAESVEVASPDTAANEAVRPEVTAATEPTVAAPLTATATATANADAPQELTQPVGKSALPPPPATQNQDSERPSRGQPTMPAPVAKNPTAVVVSKGERVKIDEKGFSVIPPEGWEIKREVGVAALLLQAQKQAGMTYQRSIQVMAFESPRFIDNTTAKEFEEYLVKKFSEVSAAIEDYRIRNNTDIEMSDGRKGILFYSEFKFDGVAMMQAHVLVSSQTRHYLTTYTDIAEHFEQEENQAFLAEAWGAMTSLELDSGTPNRFEGPMFAGIAVFVVSSFLGIFLLIRYRMARKRYEQLAASDLTAENAISAVPSTLNSSIVTLSDADLDEENEASDGDGEGSSSIATGKSGLSGMNSGLESHPGDRLNSKAS